MSVARAHSEWVKISLTATRTRAAYTHYQSGHKTETTRCVMLVKGQYVRHKMARETLIGTIEGTEIQRGRVFYRFQQDPRLREPASALLRETSFWEDELELCDRPSDEYWASINRRIEVSSRSLIRGKHA